MIFIYNTIIQNLLMCLSIVLFLDPPFAKTGNSVNVYGVPRKHRLWISNDTTQCHNENICNDRVVPSSTTRTKQAGICLAVFGATNAQKFSVYRYSCPCKYLFDTCTQRRYHPCYDMRFISHAIDYFNIFIHFLSQKYSWSNVTSFVLLAFELNKIPLMV